MKRVEHLVRHVAGRQEHVGDGGAGPTTRRQVDVFHGMSQEGSPWGSLKVDCRAAEQPRDHTLAGGCFDEPTGLGDRVRERGAIRS